MIRALVKRLLTVSDSPNQPYDRKWLYRPTISLNKRQLEVGIEKVLTQYEGKPCEIHAQWAYFQIRFRTEAWKFGQDHIYYDGPHCSYAFGPFQFHKHWGQCEECCP